VLLYTRESEIGKSMAEFLSLLSYKWGSANHLLVVAPGDAKGWHQKTRLKGSNAEASQG